MNFVFIHEHFYLQVICFIYMHFSRIENQWIRADKWIFFATFATAY